MCVYPAACCVCVTVLFCRQGKVDEVSDLEVDINQFIGSRLKGRGGAARRFI